MSGIFGAVNRETAFALMRKHHEAELLSVNTTAGLLLRAQQNAAMYRRAEALSSKHHEPLFKHYWQAFARFISLQLSLSDRPDFDLKIATTAYYQYLIQCLEIDLNTCPDLWGLPKQSWISVKDALLHNIAVLQGRVLMHSESILVLHSGTSCYVQTLDVSEIHALSPLARDLTVQIAVNTCSVHVLNAA